MLAQKDTVPTKRPGALSVGSNCRTHFQCDSMNCFDGICEHSAALSPCTKRECPADYACHGSIRRCVHVNSKITYNGRTCSNHLDCSKDHYCSSLGCVERVGAGKKCSEDARCQDGLLCGNNVCRPVCHSANECNAGYTCYKSKGRTLGYCAPNVHIGGRVLGGDGHGAQPMTPEQLRKYRVRHYEQVKAAYSPIHVPAHDSASSEPPAASEARSPDDIAHVPIVDAKPTSVTKEAPIVPPIVDIEPLGVILDIPSSRASGPLAQLSASSLPGTTNPLVGDPLVARAVLVVLLVFVIVVVNCIVYKSVYRMSKSAEIPVASADEPQTADDNAAASTNTIE